MNKKWTRVRLSEVLRICVTSVPASQLTEINLAGVYSFGRGLFKRGPMSPAATSYKTYNRLVKDDFVISQPKAWEGALARVTPEFDGWFLSPVFPTFRAEKIRLEPSFLEWFCRRKSVWIELQRKSRGIGARRESVSPEQFLSIEIPLPPLAEQRRIVAKIDQLAAKIAEARQLKQNIHAGVESMLRGFLTRLIEGAPVIPMREIAPLVRRPVEIDPMAEYPELGIRSFGKGTFHKPALTGLEVGTKRLYRIEPGDLLFNNVFAWEGAVAIAKPDDIGRFGSHRFIACVPNSGVATGNFLCFFFLTPKGLEKLGEASPGGAGRNRTLGLEALAEINVPLPPIEKQLWFDGITAKSELAKRLQTDAGAKLEALIPSILDKTFKGEF